MRRLIAVTAAATMLLASLGVGAVAAAGPNSHSSATARNQVFRVRVTPHVVQGGRIGFTATLSHCTRADLTSGVTVMATTDLTSGTVTLNRAGTVNNTSSHSKACVWRAAFTVSPTATLGNHTVHFTLTVGSATSAKDATTGVFAPDASSGS